MDSAPLARLMRPGFFFLSAHGMLFGGHRKKLCEFPVAEWQADAGQFQPGGIQIVKHVTRYAHHAALR